MNIANTIEVAVEESGLPRKEIAARAGVHTTEISRYVTGDREPKLSTFIRLIQACGKNVVIAGEGVQPCELSP